MPVDACLLAACDSLTTLAERQGLAELAASLAPGKTILEVGTHRGGLAMLFTTAAPDCRFCTLDIKDLRTPGAPGLERAAFFLGDTTAFAAAHPDIRLDLVFLDGDHSFPGIKRDLETLAPLLAPEGIVAFHDVDPQHPGVFYYVDALRRQGCLEVTCTIDRLMAGRLAAAPTALAGEVFSTTILDADLASPMPPGTMASPQELLTGDSPGVCIGTGAFGEIVALFSGLDPSRFLHSEVAPSDASAYYLCSHFTEEISRHLIGVLGVAPEAIFAIDDVYLGRLVLRDITEQGGRALFSLAASELDRDIARRVFCDVDPDLLREMQRSGFLGHFVRLFWTS